MIQRSFRYRGARCSVRTIAPGVLLVYDVYSEYRRQGNATALMQEVITFADDWGYILKLKVREFGPPDVMTNQQLYDFYAKFGFAHDSDISLKTDMTRPRSRELQAS